LLKESTFNNQQLYSRIEETFGSEYSQEIAIRIVEQSQAKLNLELEGKSDSKKGYKFYKILSLKNFLEEINDVQEILNEMGIIDNDRKDISSSRNSNKQSKKNRKKNQNKKHVEATKVHVVENTKQYFESDIDDNTKNNQSLNNEISESFQANKNFNEDNVENDEDNEGWVLNKKDEMKLRKEEKKRKEEEERLKRINKLKGKDIMDKTYSFNNIKKMNYKEYYDAEMKKKNILTSESIIDNKIKINEDLEKINNSKQINDRKLFVNPAISFKAILDKKDSRNELNGNSKLKEENKEVKCEKEDKFRSAEKDDRALVPSNKIVNSSKFSPFTPINYLEEDALNEKYMRFILSNEDPRKIIPSLDLGVIVDELNKRFKHFQKIRMKNNCQDKNVNLTFGKFQGTDLISAENFPSQIYFE